MSFSKATSKDAPVLGGVYKLVELRGDRPQYVAKFSEDKATYPGTKQVYRFSDLGGAYDHDVITCAGEHYSRAEPLLTCVMREGRRLRPPPPLHQVRERARQMLRKLPEQYRQLHNPASYPVRTSPELERLLEQVRQGVLSPELKREPGGQ